MRKWIFTIVALLVASGLWAWWPWGEDPQIAQVRALGEQLRGQGENLPDDQRRELWGQFREQMQALSPEQRDALFADRRQQMEERMTQELRSYFALSKPERVKKLDEQIDRDQKRQRDRAARNAQRPPGQGNGMAWGGGRGPGGGQNSTPEERSARRNARLDHSSPESRALRAEYRREMDERRRQRGLPPGGGGRRFG